MGAWESGEWPQLLGKAHLKVIAGRRGFHLVSRDHSYSKCLWLFSSHDPLDILFGYDGKDSILQDSVFIPGKCKETFILAVVCITFQMLGEITTVYVLFHESQRPQVATVTSFSFVEKTVSNEALRPAPTYIWEDGPCALSRGQLLFPACSGKDSPTTTHSCTELRRG